MGRHACTRLGPPCSARRATNRPAQVPIESQFTAGLVDHLNAEIVLGTVRWGAWGGGPTRVAAALVQPGPGVVCWRGRAPGRPGCP